MKNSKLVTAGILLLTFLFIDSVQRNIFRDTDVAGNKFESAATRGFTAFAKDVEQAEQVVFSSILVMINEVALTINRALGIAMGPLACTKVTVEKPKEPCVQIRHSARISAGSHPGGDALILNSPPLPCNEPCLIYPRIAGLGVVC